MREEPPKRGSSASPGVGARRLAGTAGGGI